MKETLHIKNFGPIKEVKLELGKVNVLIGDQGTGKTIIGKILCICRYFSYIKELNNGFIFQALQEWGIQESLKIDSYILYSNYDYDFEILGITFLPSNKNSGENILLPLTKLKSKSERFKKLEIELDSIKPPTLNLTSEYSLDVSELYGREEWIPPPTFFQNNVSMVMDNPIFIPTERLLQSIFSLGKSSIQNINDALFNQFSKLDGIQRRFNKIVEIEPLGIQYKNENGQGQFKTKGKDTFFKMDNAPSGYKTTIPIVLIFKYYTEFLKKNKTFVIDEPENSLFPGSQKKIINFLINRTVNYLKENSEEIFDNKLILTTHSPYILTSLNNLMYAYTVGKNHKEKVSEIIEEKFWLNPSDVSAYMMLEDGTCEDIMDKEEGMIDSIRIDSVSDILSDEFNKIMAIELKK